VVGVQCWRTRREDVGVAMSYTEKFVSNVRNRGVAGALAVAARFLMRKSGLRISVSPYDYVQRDAERNLHRYLGVECKAIGRILLVGAHLGYEVPGMLRRYPGSNFVLFEASPKYLTTLMSKFSSSPRVSVFGYAVAAKDSVLEFFETNLAGSGSLLEVSDLGAKSYGMAAREVYSVEARSLDSLATEAGFATGSIDCLWIDVQGAEMGVLEGAGSVLARVRSVFLEVSVFEPLYVGGAVIGSLTVLLEAHGFKMVSLGTDSLNGTGNAFFVRR